MHTEIKTWRWTCDFCGTTLTQTSEGDRSERPEGWSKVERERHDCGLTGYTSRTRLDRCPECKIKAEQAALQSEQLKKQSEKLGGVR